MRRLAIVLVATILFIRGVYAAIINPLPYIFQNGTVADATQVNADLAQIVNNVNTNAPPGGLNSQLQYNCSGIFCGDPAAPTAGTGNYITVNARGAVTAQKFSTAAECRPVDPTGVANNSTGVMMGLACSFTPTSTGRVLITVSGVNNSNVVQSNTETVAIRYGTGTAPANGAALTGTIVGAALAMQASGCTASNDCLTFARQGLVTGLAVGTAIWVDVSWATTSTSATACGPVSIVIDFTEL